MARTKSVSKFTKSDLKSGMVVEYANGKRRLRISTMTSRTKQKNPLTSLQFMRTERTAKQTAIFTMTTSFFATLPMWTTMMMTTRRRTFRSKTSATHTVSESSVHNDTQIYGGGAKLAPIHPTKFSEASK